MMQRTDNASDTVTPRMAVCTVNGFGAALYGFRDYDPVSDSHVTTHVITALYLPVYFVAAYRVLSTTTPLEGGQEGERIRIVGRAPLTSFQRKMNDFLAPLAVTLTALFIFGLPALVCFDNQLQIVGYILAALGLLLIFGCAKSHRRLMRADSELHRLPPPSRPTPILLDPNLKSL